MSVRPTFELSGRRRQDARPGLVKMYGVPPARAWWPAVGAPLERGVRPHFASGVRLELYDVRRWELTTTCAVDSGLDFIQRSRQLKPPWWRSQNSERALKLYRARLCERYVNDHVAHVFRGAWSEQEAFSGHNAEVRKQAASN